MALSNETLNLLSQFVMCNIQARMNEGITYDTIESAEKANIELCKSIRAAIKADGEEPNNYLQIYSLSNGIIALMPPKTCLQLTNILFKKSLERADMDAMPAEKRAVIERMLGTNVVGTNPEQRRAKDAKRLVKQCVARLMETGQVTGELEVALYSRNIVPTIAFTARQGGVDVHVQYSAYAFTHSDFGTLREVFERNGMALREVLLGEILPTRTGVRAMLKFAAPCGVPRTLKG